MPGIIAQRMTRLVTRDWPQEYLRHCGARRIRANGRSYYVLRELLRAINQRVRCGVCHCRVRYWAVGAPWVVREAYLGIPLCSDECRAVYWETREFLEAIDEAMVEIRWEAEKEHRRWLRIARNELRQTRQWLRERRPGASSLPTAE